MGREERLSLRTSHRNGREIFDLRASVCQGDPEPLARPEGEKSLVVLGVTDLQNDDDLCRARMGDRSKPFSDSLGLVE